MEDLIPIETVLADMESDCGIVAEAAKDYLNIHRDEYAYKHMFKKDGEQNEKEN